MSTVTIERLDNSNGRSSADLSTYSGGMFYGAAPSGWDSYTHPLFPSVIIKAKQVSSATNAVASGIIPNSDNTANTYTSLCTIGDIGDVVKIECTVPVLGGGTSTITLATLTLASATLALQGAEIAAKINGFTYLTGFSATFATATLTIIAPTKYGIYLNTGTPYTFTVTAISVPVHTFAFGTQTLGVSGTASLFADAYYQISEYFRMNVNGNLWVGFISASSSFQEILALQLASGNILRRMWIADTDATRGAAANLLNTATSIQSIVTNISNTYPVEITYRPNIKAVSDLSTLPNSQLLTATNNVQVLISQDGDAQGNLLYNTLGYSVSNVGAKLGTASKARLSASDAQPISQFNVSDGTENKVAAFSNGQLLTAIDTTSNTQLYNYGYVFFTNYPGNVSGNFWNSNRMYVSAASRYAYMNDNMVWDEVTRICLRTYIPQLNSEVIYEGKNISSLSIKTLQALGVNAITAALITGKNPPMISGTPVITIPADQDIQATNTLNISVGTQENGIIRDIVISNGYTN